MNPEELAKSKSEHAEQRALFCWANKAAAWGFAVANYMPSYGMATSYDDHKPVPVLKWLHAIPNAGARGNAVAASQLKAEGVKAGVADIFLPVTSFTGSQHIHSRRHLSGLYIELKRANGKPSDCTKEQTDFGGFVISQGFAWKLCFGWRHAAQTIEEYLTYRLTM